MTTKGRFGLILGVMVPVNKGPKGSKIKLSLISSKIELLGFFDIPNLTVYFRFLIFGPVFKLVYIKVQRVHN